LLSNLKQIGGALNVYAADWDGDMAWPFGLINGWTSNVYWKIRIDLYLKTRGVWLCPSNPVGDDDISEYLAPHPNPPDPDLANPFDMWPRRPYSYTQSDFAFSDAEFDAFKGGRQPSDNDDLRPRNMADFGDASGVITVFEISSEYDRFPDLWAIRRRWESWRTSPMKLMSGGCSGRGTMEAATGPSLTTTCAG
jgi:hypothetical protein